MISLLCSFPFLLLSTVAFRATFEDKLLVSDIVFLATWVPVQVPHYYNPVTSLLLHNKTSWDGMRTLRHLRHEEGLRVPLRRDSLYKEQVRGIRRFNPLKSHWSRLILCVGES